MSVEPVRIWHVLGDEVAAAAAQPRLRALLSPGEGERAARFRSGGDAHRFVTGRVLARLMLAEATGTPPAALEVQTDRRGRPHLAGRLPGPRPAFSITHTDGLVACAVALEGGVGVDAEHSGRRSDVDRIARRFFAADEVRLLDALPPTERRDSFFAIWTLKEAYLKARGDGITLPLASFSFDPSSSPPGFSCDPSLEADPSAWRFLGWRATGEHVMALAVRGSGPGTPGVARTLLTAGELVERLERRSDQDH